MRRFYWILLAVLVSLSPATASERALPPGLEGDPVFADPTLIWQVPDEVAGAPQVTIVVEYLRDGKVIAGESFTVEMSMPAAETPRAVELLSDRPDQRAVLTALGTGDEAEVIARIFVGDRFVDEIPLRSARVTRDSDRSGLTLLPIRFTEELSEPAGLDLATTCSARSACEAGCDAMLLDCLDMCSYYGGSCDSCYTDFNICVANCPDCSCTEPRRVWRETTTTLWSRDFLRSDCYDGYVSDGVGTYWNQYRYTYRNVEKEYREACDGSVTSQTVRVYYTYGSCWTESYFPSCSIPFAGWPSPRCS